MSHCSPAGSCLAKSLLLHVLCTTPLPSQFNREGPSASGMAMKRLQTRGGQEGRWGKVSDELAYQPLLPLDMCYLGMAQGDYQSLARDTERLPVYNLLPGTNDLCEKTNQGTLPLMLAPWSFLTVWGDKGSTTIKDGRLSEVEKAG